MKLRSALASTALGIGAVAATNAGLRRTAGDLPPALDGMQRTFRWRGMNVAYTERGDADDPTLVLLHGINAAGSSGEWRGVWEPLAEEYHVVVPDLPGFGRSERPPLRYSAALYEDFVADFLAEFAGADVLASSLTAAYAVDAAGSVDVGRLLLVSPTTVAGPDPPKPWLREFLRLPVVGEAAFNALASKPSIRYFNADHGYADASLPGDEWEDYEWRTAHQENARFAPASFVAGYLNSDLDLGGALADLDVDTTLVWGREADITPLAAGRDLATQADCRLVVFDEAKLLPHVEWAEEFAAVVAGDVPRTNAVVVEHDPADGTETAGDGATHEDADADDGVEAGADDADGEATPTADGDD